MAKLSVCCMADLHGRLPRIPECDLLLLAGDFWQHVPGADDGFHSEQHSFLAGQMHAWLSAAPIQQMVIAIPGNHDTLFHAHPEEVPILPWSLLKQSATTRYALRPQFDFSVWGNARTSWWGDDPLKHDRTETLLRTLCASCPEGVDIILSHGPAYGHRDMTATDGHAGSVALTETIERCHPRLVVCGHIHEGRGIEYMDDTLIVNASLCDENYLIHHNPILLTWDTESRKIDVVSC